MTLTSLAARFASDLGVGVLGKASIQNSIRDNVGKLVRVSYNTNGGGRAGQVSYPAGAALCVAMQPTPATTGGGEGGERKGRGKGGEGEGRERTDGPSLTLSEEKR